MSQQPELEQELESIHTTEQESSADLGQVAEDYNYLLEHPVEINFADQEEFQKLPYLNIFQINNLLQYRGKTGPIYSKYELMAVKGFDRETITKILPYLDFKTIPDIPEIKARNVWLYSRHNFIVRYGQVLNKRQGFKSTSPNPYLGKPGNYYMRYRANYRDLLSLGLIAQQDPGEPFGKPWQKSGVDHLSGHVALTNYGKLRSLIIGDYQVEFGQGLACWTGTAFGKSIDPLGLKRFARGFRTYTGSEENRFMRGVASSIRIWDHLDVSAFYSRNRIDANLADSALQVTSLQSSGLHRSETELADKNSIALTSRGANLNYKGNGYSAGFSAVDHQLNLPLKPNNELYRQFNFQGSRLTNFSVDFNYLYRDLNIFGELASDQQGHMAGTIGLQSNPSDGFYLTILHRHFNKKYQAFYNAPVAELGGYGEKGSYLGIRWEMNARLLLRTSADIYHFDWLRFRTNAPSKGYDLQSQLDIAFNRFLSCYIRLKHEVNETNSDDEPNPTTLVERQRSNLRIHFNYSVSRDLKAASRVEHSFLHQGLQKNKGMVLFQDITYKPPEGHFSFSSRIALIDVENYDVRIYAYERDLLYSFSIPAYYGRSLRQYFMAAFDFSQNIQVQGRIGVTRFFDRDVISSGNQEIVGNTITDVKLQVRWKF